MDLPTKPGKPLGFDLAGFPPNTDEGKMSWKRNGKIVSYDQLYRRHPCLMTTEQLTHTRALRPPPPPTHTFTQAPSNADNLTRQFAQERAATTVSHNLATSSNSETVATAHSHINNRVPHQVLPAVPRRHHVPPHVLHGRWSDHKRTSIRVGRGASVSRRVLTDSSSKPSEVQRASCSGAKYFAVHTRPTESVEGDCKRNERGERHCFCNVSSNCLE
jgi:hypothetical protein